MKEKEIKVLKVEPHKNPEEITLENELKAMQEAVGGIIEFVSLDSDNSIEILCNEEGKDFFNFIRSFGTSEISPSVE